MNCKKAGCRNSKSMPDHMDFRALQLAFAAHIRDPQKHPPPDAIEDRRMAIYRDLFFRNIASLLGGTFPVLRRILGDEGWTALIRDYFSRHRAQTPYFLEMPQEFLGYLANERGERGEDPPWLFELAHYEWVELALAVSDEEPDLKMIDPDGDLLTGRPVLSPLAWPLKYRFPVHRIGPDFQPETAPDTPTYLVVFRDPDDKVGFMEINIVTARLLELVAGDDPRCGRELLAQIGDELGEQKSKGFLAAGEHALTGLRDKHILLGVRRRGRPRATDGREET